LRLLVIEGGLTSLPGQEACAQARLHDHSLVDLLVSCVVSR
jgi:hypothetical protein